MHKNRSSSVLQKFGWNQPKKTQKLDETGNVQTWVHPASQLQDSFVIYHAKYLGTVVVTKPKGVDIVKDAIRKLKIARQVKKSEAGNKGSKMQKVEIHINIECIKVLDGKTKSMICSRPLHRVSYCADDHSDKRLFAFIAKDQETKMHNCFAFFCEKEASELTLTFGQAFQMAYRRYIEKEKKETKKTKELLSLEKQIEKMKTENEHLKKVIEKKKSIENEREESTDDNSNIFSYNGQNSIEQADPSAIPDFQSSMTNPYPTSPDVFLSGNDVSFDASFATMQAPKNDIFDPFANFDSKLNVNTQTSLAEQDNSISLFPVENYHTNTQNVFDDFGSSPKQEDFFPKTDPFADTPDWNSVASEEISVSSGPNNCNPFSIGAVQPSTGFNPFGVESAEPNGIVNSGSGVENTQGNFSDFSNDDSNNDLFSRYLSNVVASREGGPTILKKNVTTQNDQNIFSDSLFNNKPGANTVDLTTNNDHNGAQNTAPNQFVSSSNNVLSFDTLSLTPNQNGTNVAQQVQQEIVDPNFNESVTGNFFNPSLNNETIKDNSFSELNETDDGFSFDAMDANSVNQKLNSDSTKSQTFRPRPSSQGTLNRGLPAPPSKKDTKASLKNVPSPAIIKRESAPILVYNSTIPSNNPKPVIYNDIKQAPTLNFNEKIVSSSHVLPNVGKGRSVETMDVKSRSRTASKRVVPPIKDSISKASKSLDDLASCGSPPNAMTFSKASNPFAVSADSSPQHQTHNQASSASDGFASFDAAFL